MKRHQGWLALVLAAGLFLPPAYAQQTYKLEIPAQSLSSALTALADQTGIQIAFFSEVAEGQQASQLVGEYSVEQAMGSLLAGTELVYQQLDENGSITVQRKADAAGASAGNASAGALNPDADPGVNTSGEPTTESVTSQRRGGIEEIIVTARKREESVQDIPISITALSAEDIKVMGIRNLGDMEGIVPGLNMSGGGNGVKKDNNPFIRGVGQRETKVTLDPAVGTYIDGIYLGRPSGGILDVAAVESIEVLRGPQGTLFGRNSTGGAISVTLKKPTNEWAAALTSNVGNYGRSDVTASLNVPLIRDNLLGRLTVASTNSDGYFTNTNDNSTWGGDNRITGIGQLRWLAADNFTVDVLGERTRIRETPRPMRCAVIRQYDQSGSPNPTVNGIIRDENGNFVGFGPIPNPQFNPNYFAPTPVRAINELRAQDGRPSFQDLCEQSAALPQDRFASDMAIGSDVLPKARYFVDTSTVGLTANWDIGDLGALSGLALKSISAWRRVDQIADEDLDAVGASYLLRVQPDFSRNTQLSQELQLTGRALDDRLFFSTGLYYFTEESPKDDLLLAAGLAQSISGTPVSASDLAAYGLPAGSQYYPIRSYEPVLERLTTDNEAYAAYGQVDFDITPELQVTAGVRYTRETRWSRYDKALVMPESFSDSFLGAEGFLAPFISNGIAYANASAPGLNSILDWEYAAREFILNPNGNGLYISQLVPNKFVGDELETTDEAWTPMVSFKYKPDSETLSMLHLDDAMVYLTYSEGFHSGGVTAGAVDFDVGTTFLLNPDGTQYRDPVTNQPIQLPPEQGYGTADPVIFKPEFVKNYEIGLKATAFDRRLQTNIALFYMDYTDMQLSSIALRDGIPIPFVENAGKSIIRGVELELVIAPLPGWRVMANSSYTDADIKEWQSTSYNLFLQSGNPNGPPTFFDRSDEPMPRVPRVQAFVLTDYAFNLKGGSVLTPSIAARYTSEIWHGFDRGSFLYGQETVTSGKQTFLDGRVSWISADAQVEIAAWGKNLTNVDDYMVGAIALADVTGGTGLIYANPRTFGLAMTYNFGLQ